MTYHYFHCEAGSLEIRPAHAFLTYSAGGGRHYSPPAEQDRIARLWCDHFCKAGVPHALQLTDEGLAQQVYRHMIYVKRGTCCPAYKEILRASA